GRTAAYGKSTPNKSAGAGIAALTVSAVLTALPSGKTFHYRLVATNAAGRTRGLDQTFKTKGASVGNDVLNGTPLADLICGLAGNDTIKGFAGADTLFGDQCNQNRLAVAAARD